MLDKIISPEIREKISQTCEHLEVFFKYSMCKKVPKKNIFKDMNWLEGLGNFFLHPQLHMLQCSQGFWEMHRVELLNLPSGKKIKSYRIYSENIFQHNHYNVFCNTSMKYLFGKKPDTFALMVTKTGKVCLELLCSTVYFALSSPALLTIPIGIVLKALAYTVYQDVRLRHNELFYLLHKEKLKSIDESFLKIGDKIQQIVNEHTKQEAILKTKQEAILKTKQEAILKTKQEAILKTKQEEILKEDAMEAIERELSRMRETYIGHPDYAGDRGGLNLLDLPNEILDSIIQYLNPCDINLVCRRFLLLTCRHRETYEIRNKFELLPDPIQKLLKAKFSENVERIPLMNLPAHKVDDDQLQPVGTNVRCTFVNFLKPRDMILDGKQESIAMFKTPDGRLGIAFLYVIRSQKFITLDKAPLASWRISEMRTKLKVGTIHQLVANKPYWCITTGKKKNAFLPGHPHPTGEPALEDLRYLPPSNEVLSDQIFQYMTNLFSNMQIGGLFVHTALSAHSYKIENYYEANSLISIELWKEKAIQKVS